MERGDDTVSPGSLVILGGVLLLLYVLTKEWFVVTVGHAPRLVDQESGLVWHLLENVPIAMIGTGLLIWYRSRESLNRWDRLGVLMTVSGLAWTFVSHVFEHVALLIGTSSSLAFWFFVSLYYAGWVVTCLGLTTIGASRAGSDLLGPTQRSVVVWIVPVSVVVAVVLGTTLFVSISDGFKIPAVLAMIAIGINLRFIVERTDVLER